MIKNKAMTNKISIITKFKLTEIKAIMLIPQIMVQTEEKK